MRYELRRWTDETHTKYNVRQRSDDLEAIRAQYNRALSASTAPNLIYIADTEEEKSQ